MFKCLLTSCNLLAYTYVPKPKPYTFFNKKWLVTATGRALHLKHCLVECNVSVFLIVPCWFMWIKHCTKYFLLFAKEMGFFFPVFFPNPPFSPIVFDMDFCPGGILSLCVFLHILVYLAGGYKGSESRSGVLWWNSVAIWSLQSLNHVRKRGKGESERGGKTEIGGKRQREWRRFRGNRKEVNRA